MPTYDYYCSECKETTERYVSYADRDAQVCDCGNKLERRFNFTNAIHIPEGFGEYTKSCFLPRTDEEKATWERDGVTAMRGENSVTSDMLVKAAKAVGD